MNLNWNAGDAAIICGSGSDLDGLPVTVTGPPVIFICPHQGPRWGVPVEEKLSPRSVGIWAEFLRPDLPDPEPGADPLQKSTWADKGSVWTPPVLVKQ